MFSCIWAAFKANFPNIGLWLLAVVIACLIAAGITAIGGPGPIAAVIVGCLIVVGVSIAAAALLALAQAIWACI